MCLARAAGMAPKAPDVGAPPSVTHRMWGTPSVATSTFCHRRMPSSDPAEGPWVQGLVQ